MNHRRPYFERPSAWITVRGFVAEFVVVVVWVALILFATTWGGPK